jgi:pyrroline-5-carboxylate reductase
MHPLLVILGGGNMARAIVSGGLRAASLRPDRIALADPDSTKLPHFRSLGIHTFTSPAAALAHFPFSSAPQLLLAVKPQSFNALADDIAPTLGPARRTVISIMAGVHSSRIRTLLSRNGTPIAVVRSMPNLPAQIGEGATALALGDGASPGDEAFASSIFQGLGPIVLHTQEHMIDAFTALAGSGPAYLFYLAEAMTAAAERMGFSPQDARDCTAQTLKGAALMLAASTSSPADLRAAVTSKGGTTQAATEVLDSRLVKDALVDAILAAEKRGQSLANS